MSGVIVRNWEELTKSSFTEKGSWAVTIGVFDGMHVGHQQLIQKIVRGPERSLVVTFRENPKKILRPQTFMGNLMSWEDKLVFWDSFGVDEVVLIDFSPDFGKMTGEVFLRTLLKNYRVRFFVLGWNFSFGNRAQANVEHLKAWVPESVEIEVVGPIEVGGRIVSSSLVRQAVLEGKMDEVARFLGRNYKIIPPPTAVQRGTDGWFVPIQAWNQVLPRPGKYRVLIDSCPGFLEVNKETVFWESPPGAVAKEILFKE
jgi:riboflavin kinase/FMN adenylyltransferase